MTEDVLFEKRDGVGLITLNRPDTLNAMGGMLIPMLGDFLAAAERGYREILELAPGCFDAAHLLGVLLIQRGAFEGGVARLRQAIAIDGSQWIVRVRLARVLLDTKIAALLVPQRSVQELQNLYSVAVVNPDNTVAFRNIKVGQRVDSMWVVDEGLKPGEKVPALVLCAGFGSARDTNARFRYLLSQGQSGLSVAFDLPTLMGYDADHSMAEGEVGKGATFFFSIFVRPDEKPAAGTGTDSKT